MKKAAPIVLFGLSLASLAQTAQDYAVLLTAGVRENPPQITLQWPPASATSYDVYRKEKTQVSFPATSLATLPGTASDYADVTVEVGKSYEYHVKKTASAHIGHGYINAGIKVPAMHVKGKLVLLVDSSQAVPLANELSRLENDLDADGWAVVRMDVSPARKPGDIRNDMIDLYNADPQFVKAVFILGHVPVPYSGNLAPDGHSDHVGAWPCDSYYGEMNSGWGDNIINNTSASDSRNHNVPGDGKFDHTFFPSNVELQVGRVDFANMPAFARSETELLRAYLNKDHLFRTGRITAVPRALIDDHFNGFGGEAFAASGWKAFAPMFGPDSIRTADYFTTLKNANYMWSYGCGGGTHTSASGIGNTGDFTADSLQSVFTLLFGSYFGDWDRQDNFLRAPLAQGITLTNAWSGRPHWHFHHMALGENIGYSVLPAVNNGPYFSNFAAGYVHIALMGDPTLRMHIIRPPSALVLSEVPGGVGLSWTASPDAVLGYHVYRKESRQDNYQLLNAQPVTGTAYNDLEVDHTGEFYYSVRAVRLEEVPSGSYYNLSSGVSGSLVTQHTVVAEESSFKFSLYPNPGKGFFQVDMFTGIAGTYTAHVYSIDGREAHCRLLELKAGENRFTLELETQPGLYVLRLQHGTASVIQRFVIEN